MVSLGCSTETALQVFGRPKTKPGTTENYTLFSALETETKTKLGNGFWPKTKPKTEVNIFTYFFGYIII